MEIKDRHEIILGFNSFDDMNKAIFLLQKECNKEDIKFEVCDIIDYDNKCKP